MYRPFIGPQCDLISDEKIRYDWRFL